MFLHLPCIWDITVPGFEQEILTSPMPSRASTIEDVAELAGVSIATVSRALHKPDIVSEKTKERVWAAVRETGYTLNTMAQNLRLKKSGMIVVLVPDISNPFFSGILSGIESEMAKKGYNTLIANTQNAADRERIYRTIASSNLADGLLVLNGALPSVRGSTPQDPANLPPTVILCERIPDCSLPTVIVDNVGASYQATKHLIDTGHTRIGHLAGPSENILTHDRLQGYRTAIEDAGILFDKKYVLKKDFTISSGYEGTKTLMSQQDCPTALFCASDEIAMGAMKAAKELGLTIPNDLSIVGFDDIEVADCYSPPLTTVHQPRQVIGKTGARLLLQILENDTNNISSSAVTLKTNLVIRESVSPPQE